MKVLILVVMEDGLVHSVHIRYETCIRRVLILVVMEDGLVQYTMFIQEMLNQVS